MTEMPQSAPQLSILTVRPGTGTVEVHLAGEVDLATAEQLREALLAVVSAAAPPGHVHVDLGKVSFIDAMGAGVLVGTREAARRARISFSVDNADGVVRQVLEVLGMISPSWTGTGTATRPSLA